MLSVVATYAIGDIQGCFEPFERLLRKIDFSDDRDRLWVAGDLVNRGPHSLDVVSWMKDHEANVQMVLGNHEIHLFRRATGTRKKKLDTLGELLERPDLIAWLRGQPFMIREEENVMVHAGLLPDWSWEDLRDRAASLRGALELDDAQRATRKALTLLRLVDDHGAPHYDFKGPPEEAPAGLIPWFEAPRKTEHLTVWFGHWAALGHRMGDSWVALDSGCVWGNQLTAVRMEDRAVFQVEAR